MSARKKERKEQDNMKRQGEEYNRGFLETVREYKEERE